MNILLAFSGFIITFVVVWLYECRIRLMRKEPNKNKVHFYVARDMNGELWLYIGKPVRRGDEFSSNEHGDVMLHSFKSFGLNPDDFKNLKWEDEPVEVFLNLED